MAHVGDVACVPVGPDAIPAGFENSAGAWGFLGIVGETCTAQERRVIGSNKCVPVDDCNGTFPPPNATFVVNRDLSLPDAIRMASPGDTIAIDSGVYASIQVDRDIHLVGRCSSKVIFQAASNDQNAIRVEGPYNVSIQSIQFEGFPYAVWTGSASGNAVVEVHHSMFYGGEVAAWVTNGGSLNFHDNFVASDPATMLDGVIVGSGGQATISNTEFRDIHVAVTAFGSGSRASVVNVAAMERSPEESALLVSAEGGNIDVDSSYFLALDRFVGGLTSTDVRDPGKSLPATMTIKNSALVRVAPTDAAGFDVSGGSSLELINSTLAYRARIAISAETDSTVKLTKSVIRPVETADPGRGTIGSAIVINDSVRLSLDTSVIVGASQSAILAAGQCQILLTNSLIRDTWEFERTDLHTRFSSGQAISLMGHATLQMTDSTLLNNASASIWMGSPQSSLLVKRSTFLNTIDAATANAQVGLLAWSGTIEVSDSLFDGLPDSAIDLGDVTGVVASTVVSGSAIAFRTTGATTMDSQDDATIQPTANQVLTRSVTLVDTPIIQANDELPIGDCHCSK